MQSGIYLRIFTSNDNYYQASASTSQRRFFDFLWAETSWPSAFEPWAKWKLAMNEEETRTCATSVSRWIVCLRYLCDMHTLINILEGLSIHRCWNGYREVPPVIHPWSGSPTVWVWHPNHGQKRQISVLSLREYYWLVVATKLTSIIDGREPGSWTMVLNHGH